MERRHHKKTKLQCRNGQYTLTIPAFFVEKVLVAKKGDSIDFDFQGGEVILKKKNE